MYIRLNIRKDEGSRLVSLGFERFSRVGGITVTLVTMGPHQQDMEMGSVRTPTTPCENGGDPPQYDSMESHDGSDRVKTENPSPTAPMNPDVWMEKSKDISDDMPDGEMMPSSSVDGAGPNMYVTARVHVQRVIDVTLLISNMSRLSTILHRRFAYEPIQLQLLVCSLVVSMIAQIVAGTCFFISQNRELHKRPQKPCLDYVAYACVAIVMVLNIFISTFDAGWSGNSSDHTHATNRSDTIYTSDRMRG